VAHILWVDVAAYSYLGASWSVVRADADRIDIRPEALDCDPFADGR
jgi:hypothetical protein